MSQTRELASRRETPAPHAAQFACSVSETLGYASPNEPLRYRMACLKGGVRPELGPKVARLLKLYPVTAGTLGPFRVEGAKSIHLRP